ncbi:MAG: CsgG/HfaB family protein [Elusimicrobiota bacterium]
MKKIMFFATTMLLLNIFCFAEDAYDKLAMELASYASNVKKMAVIPFSYADNTTSTKDGSIISERLTMKLINMQRFEIIERSVLNKVLDELKLQNSGVIDPSSAKELGKVLGVDAIITGTLVPTSDGKIEVNARIIKTDTAQAIGASQVYVVKDWIGGDAQILRPQPIAQNQSTKPTYTDSTNKYRYSFFDVIVGFSSGKLEATADESNPLPFPGLIGSWSEMSDVTVNGLGPMGIRIGGYGKGIIGGDLELAVYKYKTPKQNISWSNGQILSMPDGYFDITSFLIGGDLLLRTLTKVQFYFGMGLGLSIDKITSSYITDKYGKKLNEIALGVMLRFPIGIRFNTDNTTFFVEFRPLTHSTSFDRGTYGNESHDITVTSPKFCLGIGSKF